MHFLRYISLLVLIPTFGQVSVHGRFSVDFDRGCAPLTVNVTEMDGFGNISRQYFYENSTDVTSATTHTYTTPGVYNLVQLVGIDVVPKTDTLVIEVFEPIAPNYNYFLCDSRQIQLQIDDTYYDSYDVTFGSSGPISLLDGQTATYTYGMAEPLSIQVKGVFAGAADNCAPSSFVLPNVQDNLVAANLSAISVEQACEGEYHVSFSSNAQPDIVYRVMMSVDGGVYQQIEESTLSTNEVLNNVGINSSNTDVCVRVDAYNICDGTTSTGTPLCQTLGSNDLNPVQGLYSTYENGDIVINPGSVNYGEYIFERSGNGATFSEISRNTTMYVDRGIYSGRQYFYRVSYADTCANVWNEQATQPPFISFQPINENRFLITLDEAVQQTGESLTYSAVLTSEGGSVIEPITANPFELTLSPELGERQALTVVGNATSFSVLSNELIFRYEFVVFAPKAFTPNGDGLNDRLEFYGLGDATAQLKIYTRWGQQIYGEVSSAPAWDGRINGELADEGVYIYEISIPERSNHVQKGSFALIKK